MAREEERFDTLEDGVAEAEELLLRSGFDPMQVQSAGRGSHHHLFVVEVDQGPLRLLRMPRKTFSRESARILIGEAEACQRTRPFLPVPHPVLLLPNNERPEASMVPILPGKKGSDLRQDSGPMVDRVCHHLGTALAQLHRIELRSDDRTLIRELSEYGPDRVLLHGDVHLGNILVDSSEEEPRITCFLDWSFCRWGPPEVDLVEMAICEAEPRPRLGRMFYEAYLDAGGLPPRESVFRRALLTELQRRLEHHDQSHELAARDVWTRWANALRRPDANATRVFDSGRAPGRGLV